MEMPNWSDERRARKISHVGLTALRRVQFNEHRQTDHGRMRLKGGLKTKNVGFIKIKHAQHKDRM